MPKKVNIMKKNELQFWGGSRIVSPNGNIIAQAKLDEEDLVIGSVDYTDLERAEVFAPTLRDLRPELFNSLKEQTEKL